MIRKDFTDFAQTLLKKHYSQPTDTCIEDIFKRAINNFSYGDIELANRLQFYIDNKWFNFSSPPLSNSIDGEWIELETPTDWKTHEFKTIHAVKSMPISCFVGDTKIITKDGYKLIADLEIGDYVLTHKGRFRPIENTKKSESSDLYKVSIGKGNIAVTVTGNHLLLTNTGWKRVDELNKWVDLIATDYKLNETVELEHIIKIINPEDVVQGGKRTQLNTDVKVNKELAWSLGFWFAEGSTTDNGSVVVTNQSTELLNRWMNAMRDSFGVNSTLNPCKGRNWLSAGVYSKTLQEFFDVEFGKGCKNKNITEWILNLPNSHLQEFYNGLYAGDGSKKSNARQIELSNSKLIASLHLILMKLGIKHSTQLNKMIKYTNTKGTLVNVENGLITEAQPQNDYKRLNTIQRGIEFDGLLYKQIFSLDKLNATEYVYDIQVSEDESFSANTIIAHNCFIQAIPDSLIGQIEAAEELSWLSVSGGGVGQAIQIRGITEKSPGAIPYLKTVDSNIMYYRQGSTRRGSVASYLNVSHPDIIEFLGVRNPTGGDINRKCHNINIGVNITDEFLYAIDNNLDWHLKCPKTNEVTATHKARDIWQEIIETRFKTGEPYIHYIDESNRRYKEFLGSDKYYISSSNLCTEIISHCDEENTVVCCLSSLNLEYYDEWKDTRIVEDLVILLDNVLEWFITYAPKELWKAVNFAKGFRDLGIGTMGWHYYLQKNNIPFESGGIGSAAQLTNIIFKSIKEKALAQSVELAKLRGEPEYLKGLGRRNAQLLAPAPNANCVSPDTVILLSDNTPISYKNLIGKLGLDFNSFEDIEVVLEYGEIRTFKYNEEILIKRDGKCIEIFACELLETDEL